MKKVMVYALLLATLFCACKKSTTTTVTPDELYIPWTLESLMPTKNMYLGSPFSNVSGVLTTCKTTGSFIDSTGTTNEYKRSWKYASSLDSLATVKINGVSLNPFATLHFVSSRIYTMKYTDDGSLWNESSTNTWSVNSTTGASFTTTISGILPSFCGTLPATLSATSDFDYTFNAANTSNADSAHILIYHQGYIAKSTTVNTYGGTAHIAASQLRDPISGALPSPDITTTIEGKTYPGTLMAVILYSHSIGTYGGKKYAFVRQRVILHIVNLT